MRKQAGADVTADLESQMDASKEFTDAKMIEARNADSQVLQATRNKVQRFNTLRTEHPGQALPSLLRQMDPAS